MARKVDLLFVAYICCAVLASIAPEIKAERYSAPSYAALVPGGNLLAVAGEASSFAVVGLGLLVLMRELLVRVGPSHRDRVPAGGFYSQARIWLPYIAAWLASAAINYVSNAPTYIFTSAFMVTVVAIYSRRHDEQGVGAAGIMLLRIYIGLSVLLGILLPARAMAPYSVWPGGWWPDADRLQGLAPHPNTLGWLAALLMASELIAGLSFKRPIGIVSMLMGAIALTESGSRTASLALLTGLLAFLLVWTRSKDQLVAVLLRIVGVAAALVTLSTLVMDGFGLDSFNGREATWQASMEAFSVSPLVGIGPFNFASGEIEGVGYAHNQIFQTLAELGILGLIALVVHSRALIRYSRYVAGGAPVWILTGMWFTMFAAENLLRFADPGFGLQIVFFQLALFYVVDKTKHRATLSNGALAVGAIDV